MSIANILTRLAGKIQKVFDAGHTKGFADGVTDANEDFEIEKETLNKRLAYALTSGALKYDSNNLVGDAYRMSLETNVNQARNDLINIKNKFGDYAIGIMIGQASSTYPELIDDVHDMGYSEGESKGLSEGIEQGKQSAYDEFWDSYQNNGNRTDYRCGFAGSGWNKTTMRPKHKIAPTSTVSMFERNTAITKMSDLGVEVDFSNVTDVTNTFCFASNLQEIEVPITLISSSSRWYQTFYYCTKLKSIKKLIVSSGQIYDNTFTACSSLENIVFEGVIGNSLNMKDSPLSKESIESVVGCLSSTATGKTLTLKKSAKEVAFTDEEWATLTANKTNWTINLI